MPTYKDDVVTTAETLIKEAEELRNRLARLAGEWHATDPQLKNPETFKRVHALSRARDWLGDITGPLNPSELEQWELRGSLALYVLNERMEGKLNDIDRREALGISYAY